MREFLRKVLSTLVRIILTPFRIITFPFRKIRDFINYEPEDTPTPEVFARTLEQPSVLLEHIGALRVHLFRAIVALFIATGISFAFATRILDFLAEPIGGIDSLQAIEVTESIGAFMRVSLLSGFALALPYILFEVFSFVNPGLKRRERIFILMSLPFAAVLFIAGLAFAFFVMLPTALPFLLNFMDITTVPRPSNYIRFVTNLMFWIGISFQFPLLIYALASLGFVRSETLVRGWRIAIIGIAVLAAVVTPTVDPVNMGLVMLPMIVLYFISIFLAKIAQRSRDRRTA
ncbi:MAG: twin-arginine translocase subunit TatC [Anaerolineales bacterium]|nr:twin-arginine translocase subunit TatC [Anaerolineales bacterium]